MRQLEAARHKMNTDWHTTPVTSKAGKQSVEPKRQHQIGKRSLIRLWKWLPLKALCQKHRTSGTCRQPSTHRDGGI